MEIKDYLHLYIGSQVSVTNIEGRYTTLLDYEFLTRFYDDEDDRFMNDPKIILRKLSSVTEEEFIEMYKNMPSGINISFKLGDYYRGFDVTPYQVKYLLSKGFDLFNLIENGLAIDLKTIKQ